MRFDDEGPGIDPDKVEKSLYDVLVNDMPISEIILEREIDIGVTYIPIPTQGVEHHQVATIEMGVFANAEFAAKAPRPFGS